MVSVVIYSENDNFVEQIRQFSGYLLSKQYSEMTEHDFINRTQCILVIDSTSDKFSTDNLQHLRFRPAYQILVVNHGNQVQVEELAHEISEVWHLPLNPFIVKKRLDDATIIIDANNKILEYISYLSMEVKNPVASVKGYADVMLSGMAGDLTQQQTQFLQTIRSNGDRINEMLQDMRDEANIRFNRFQLNLDVISLPSLLSSIEFFPKGTYIKSSPTIEVNLQDNLPKIMADKFLLKRTLLKIVRNTYSSDRTIIDVTENQRSMHFQITDFGENTYFRLPENSDEFSLPNAHPQIIIDHTIKAHGGEMWLEQSDESSAFHFTIPIAKEDKPDD